MFLKTPDKQLLLNSQIQQKVDDEGRMKLELELDSTLSQS